MEPGVTVAQALPPPSAEAEAVLRAGAFAGDGAVNNNLSFMERLAVIVTGCVPRALLPSSLGLWG